MEREEESVLGIDLGTTFSAMAYVNKFGKPEVVANAEGFPTTPSVVYFYDHDACVVGDEATKMVVVEPENVVRFIKRHMGEQDFTLNFYDKDYTPQEISALILRKLKEDAEELTGRIIRDAVITVPAYFNSAQRGATAEAGAIAGLNVLSIINEPTAAAIAYGLDQLGSHRRLLVFDLGGGTFDVTVMEIQGNRLTTIASDGNAELGGKDWDDRLVNYVAAQFHAKFGTDPRDDAVPYQELYERCLQAKISLSTKTRAVVPVNYKGKRTIVPIEREVFEEITEDLVHQCEDTVHIVLEKARLRWLDLDDILLVGGSTRMPMIRNLLESLAGREPVTSVNPDECVALGAALAGVFRHRPRHPALEARRRQPLLPKSTPPPSPRPRLSPTPAIPRTTGTGGAVVGMAYGGHVATAAPGRSTLPDVEIRDCSTHPLGIIVLDREHNERVVELIPEGTPLPHEYRGRFAYAYENMTAVRVEVTEGVGSHRDEVTVIGKVELRDLPPRPRGTPIEVIYRYGVNQILSVKVADIETGTTQETEVSLCGGLNSEELRQAVVRNQGMVVK